MPQHLALVSLVVRDYDEAIAFYVGVLGFILVEDTYQPAQDKRWVVVAPPGGEGVAPALGKGFERVPTFPGRQPDWRARVPLPLYRRL